MHGCQGLGSQKLHNVHFGLFAEKSCEALPYSEDHEHAYL